MQRPGLFTVDRDSRRSVELVARRRSGTCAVSSDIHIQRYRQHLHGPEKRDYELTKCSTSTARRAGAPCAARRRTSRAKSCSGARPSWSGVSGGSALSARTRRRSAETERWRPPWGPSRAGRLRRVSGRKETTTTTTTTADEVKLRSHWIWELLEHSSSPIIEPLSPHAPQQIWDRRHPKRAAGGGSLPLPEAVERAVKSMTEAAGADVGDERKHRCRDEMKHSLKCRRQMPTVCREQGTFRDNDDGWALIHWCLSKIRRLCVNDTANVSCFHMLV